MSHGHRVPPHPKPHYPHHHRQEEDQDSMLAHAQALRHLMSLGLPPQPGEFPNNTTIENTKALVIKKPHKVPRGIIIHQIMKQPGT
jgi:hypothetical protein